MFKNLDLLGKWIKIHRDLRYLTIKNLPAILQEFKTLEAFYGFGERHYHTLEHIRATLRFVDNYKPEGRDNFRTSVRLALFYHDCIYDATQKDNEDKSAEAFKVYAASLNMPSWLIDQVVEYIMLTKSHSLPAGSSEGKRLMNDADMSIFLTKPSTYVKYAVNIWKEYSVFGQAGYLKGRLHFLSTVNPATMFHTKDAQSRVLTAVNNLNLERAILEDCPDLIFTGTIAR
jgi:predicted metal-dependent HD superfamily phosphohydrolase